MLTNLKKLVAIAFAAATIAGPASPARADIATVAAVHEYVRARWDIDIPYAASSARQIPNMKYIMQLVDRANEKLNEYPTTNYAANIRYATPKIAADTAARDAVNTLIRKIEPYFFFTPATTSNTYSFKISAAGTFDIDWGDGQIQTIEKTNTAVQTISHTYTDGAANTHEIKLGGHATAYSTDEETAAISFSGVSETQKSGMELKYMRGCLGCVFSTIDDETVAADMRQPRFRETFYFNRDLSGTIPADLFYSVHGAPVSNMFLRTFRLCEHLTGDIPEGLFSGLSGPPTYRLFASTFNRCYGLSGIVPGGLFAGIKGAPAPYMFNATFVQASITGISKGLFSGIKGPPAEGMYKWTFSECFKLTGEIPEDLFGDIDADSAYEKEMFWRTFYADSLLTGPSAKMGGKYLYEIWPLSWREYTFQGATHLSDYSSIPTNWK